MATTNFTLSQLAACRYGVWGTDASNYLCPILNGMLAMTITGTAASFITVGVNNTYVPYLVSVDGGAYTKPAVSSSSLSLFSGLSDGPHTVYVVQLATMGYNNIKHSSSCVLAVTGSSPAVTSLGYVQSDPVWSGNFQQYGYYVAPSSRLINNSGGFDTTTGSGLAPTAGSTNSSNGLSVGPAPFTQSTYNLTRSMLTIAFRAKLQQVGVTGPSIFGSILSGAVNNQYCWAKLYRNNQLVWHGLLQPDDPAAVSAIWWVSDASRTKLTVDTGATFADWKLLISGSWQGTAGLTYGSGASLSLTLTGGTITGLTLASGGSGYSPLNSTVLIPINGGLNGTASVVINGSGVITSATLVNGGSNYTNTTVSLTGPSTLKTCGVGTVVLDAAGTFASRPPAKNATLLAVGDSRTEAVSCSDGYGDATRCWCVRLAELLGADPLIYAISGRKLGDLVGGGQLDVVRAMTTNLTHYALTQPTVAPTLTSSTTGGSLSNGTYNVWYSALPATTTGYAGESSLSSVYASITLAGGTSTQSIQATIAAGNVPAGTGAVHYYLSTGTSSASSARATIMPVAVGATANLKLTSAYASPLTAASCYANWGATPAGKFDYVVIDIGTNQDFVVHGSSNAAWQATYVALIQAIKTNLLTATGLILCVAPDWGDLAYQPSFGDSTMQINRNIWQAVTTVNDSQVLFVDISANDGAGFGATASLTTSSGVVTGVSIVAGGSGYFAPNNTIVGTIAGGGGNATALFTINNGQLVSGTVLTGGSGYSNGTNTITISSKAVFGDCLGYGGHQSNMQHWNQGSRIFNKLISQFPRGEKT